MTWVGTAAQLVVPLVALFSSSRKSVRLRRGERYRFLVAFRPPLEGERDAWRRAVEQTVPGATQITITPRGGLTLVGWAQQVDRDHVVEPGLTLYRVGNAEGVLDRVYGAGQVAT